MTKMNKKFSIIIPLHRVTKDFRECVDKCLALDYKNYEILIVSDHKAIIKKNKKIKFYLTGSAKDTPPSVKRDVALKYAKGEIIAFIDDDAYPKKDWLKKAEEIFIKNKDLAGIGGPGLTPQTDSFSQKLGGAFYESYFGSFKLKHRFVKEKEMEDYDLPAYNLFIKKSVLKEIKGFNSQYYGGEDTKVCLEIKKRGYKLLYSPKIIVYHHRRAFPKKHLKQVGNVGKQRGMFVKKYPETSRKLIYFLPAIGTILFFALIVLSFFNKFFAFIFIISFLAGYFTIFLTSLMEKGIKISALLPFVILSSHLSYGLNFMKSLLFKND